jgi:hypothetical protein
LILATGYNLKEFAWNRIIPQRQASGKWLKLQVQMIIRPVGSAGAPAIKFELRNASDQNQSYTGSGTHVANFGEVQIFPAIRK